MEQTIKTSEFLKQAEIKLSTLRYYEKIGLLVHPERDSSGYRKFNAENLKRIKFIKNAQEIGFSLKQILELLTLRISPETSCEEVKKKAREKIIEVEDKIKYLERIKKALTKLEKSCNSKGQENSCPILHELEK